MFWSCSRRSRLNSLAMLSKVCSTLGLSSASITASDTEFSGSSSSRLASPASSAASSPSPSGGLGLNGVVPAGASQAGDHGLAACLDALGDGDLALPREQHDRSHLAQIHAHRIV